VDKVEIEGKTFEVRVSQPGNQEGATATKVKAAVDHVLQALPMLRLDEALSDLTPI